MNIPPPPPPRPPPLSPDPPSPPAPRTAAPAPTAPAGPRIINTASEAKDGLNKCPSCGATDVTLNMATGKLRCGFCRSEWSQASISEGLNLRDDFLGMVMGSGAADIKASTDAVVTFKCSACGAEVVVDTEQSHQARCHWCRNTLSLNQQMPNGAIPDMILPFKLSKQGATEKIKRFVRKRRLFAHPKFKREFTTENVMGVYLPYMVVDVNAQASMHGEGEVQLRAYGSQKRGRKYDADVYGVSRQFNMKIRGLTVESSSARLNQDTASNTNNIINTILPFDLENCVKYNAYYTAGFNSERRDSNVRDLQSIVAAQTQDIARHQANSTLTQYDRGVRWDQEHVGTDGQRWMTAYLPVWLYSYYQKKSNGKTFLHYVAVNARTGETMGSIPVNQFALIGVSAVVQVIGSVLGVLLILAS